MCASLKNQVIALFIEYVSRLKGNVENVIFVYTEISGDDLPGLRKVFAKAKSVFYCKRLIRWVG
jgi:hypothetical protein